jgi:hypothetical protein
MLAIMPVLTDWERIAVEPAVVPVVSVREP